MTPASRYIYAVSFILIAGGFLLPYWPLCVAGVLLAAFSGRWIFGVCAALLLDIAWGAPGGILHFLPLPFTVLALLCGIARYWGARWFADRGLPERL